MKTLSAAAAKGDFAKYLETVQHEPVVITEAERPVAVTLSMSDIETLFGADENALAEALTDLRIDRQLARSRQQVADGKLLLADEAFFEAQRERIRTKYMTS